MPFEHTGSDAGLDDDDGCVRILPDPCSVRTHFGRAVEVTSCLGERTNSGNDEVVGSEETLNGLERTIWS